MWRYRLHRYKPTSDWGVGPLHEQSGLRSLAGTDLPDCESRHLFWHEFEKFLG